MTYYAADSVDAQGNPTDSHPLSYTRLNLPGSDLAGASAQTDCPRFTQERAWVEYGVMNQSAEVTTGYSAWAPGMASCDTTLPDGTVLRDLYGTGWQKGLTTESHVLSGGQDKKATTVTWTQDDTSAGYPINPRVTDTTISDDNNNHRRTSVSYQTFTLPDSASCCVDSLQYIRLFSPPALASGAVGGVHRMTGEPLIVTPPPL